MVGLGWILRLQVNHVVKQWYKYLESLDALGSDLGPTHGGQVGSRAVPRR